MINKGADDIKMGCVFSVSFLISKSSVDTKRDKPQLTVRTRSHQLCVY